MHPLPAAAALADEERCQHALGQEGSARSIRDRDARAPGAAARLSGHGHQSPHSLGDLIESATIAIGPLLSEARDRGVDDARIARADGRVVDSEALLDVSAEILDEHV